MINDYLEVRNAEGMPKLVDATVAMDLLLSSKNGVRNYAFALTEVASPEVREILIQHLENAINMHEEISKMMIEKKWFHPFDLNEQFHMDLISSQTATEIASLDLFPGDTSRRGTFATLYK